MLHSNYQKRKVQKEIVMVTIQQLAEEFITKLEKMDGIELGIDGFLRAAKEEAKSFLLKYMQGRIEQVDEVLALHQEMRPNWRIVRKQERVLSTSIGELHFQRRYYQDCCSKNYSYLVDQLLGIDSYQRISRELMSDVCNQAAQHSYKKSSVITCDGLLSKQSIMNITRSASIPEAPLNPQVEELQVLHIQADEDHVPGQDGINRELKLAVIHEPIQKHGKKNYLPNKRTLTQREGETVEAFWERIWESICGNYNVAEEATFYIHGDGASWIRHGCELFSNSKYVLDTFHALKYLKKIVPDTHESYTEMLEYMYQGNRKHFRKLAYQQVGKHPEKSVETQQQAIGYLLNQWSGIAIWSKDKEAGRSCAEGLVSHILSDRLSSRPMGWSRCGMHSIAEIRALHQNGGNIRTIDFPRKMDDEKYIYLLDSVDRKPLKQVVGDEYTFEANYSRALQMSQNNAYRRLFEKIKYGGMRF